jgi:hypothetical protein
LYIFVFGSIEILFVPIFVGGKNIDFVQGNSPGILVGDGVLESDVNVFDFDLDIVDDLQNEFLDVACIFVVLVGLINEGGKLVTFADYFSEIFLMICSLNYSINSYFFLRPA